MNLLIIDDDAICSFINTRVAQTSGMFGTIHTVHNGKDALDFLQSTCGDSAVNPDVILLDLNMPLINGLDCLSAIRALAHLRDLPVLMYSTSAYVEQINQSYRNGANLYIQKPASVEGIKKILRKVLTADPAQYRTQPARSSFTLH